MAPAEKRCLRPAVDGSRPVRPREDGTSRPGHRVVTQSSLSAIRDDSSRSSRTACSRRSSRDRGRGVFVHGERRSWRSMQSPSCSRRRSRIIFTALSLRPVALIARARCDRRGSGPRGGRAGRASACRGNGPALRAGPRIVSPRLRSPPPSPTRHPRRRRVDPASVADVGKDRESRHGEGPRKELRLRIPVAGFFPKLHTGRLQDLLHLLPPSQLRVAERLQGRLMRSARR